ncbi:MAG: LysR family transcriptional regulator [Chloroflexi bacterium]|nr:LysR family transcriptional regulator [Chloroflexota bacterium]
MLTYTLTEYAVLAGLAQGETLRQVGARLGLTQPGVTKLLRAAERKARAPLVQRRGRRLQLTAAGAQLARLGEPVLLAAARAEAGLESFRAGLSGRVALAATSTPGNYLVPAVLGRFLQEFPDAEVTLAVTPLDRVWELLARGAADLALVGAERAPAPFRYTPLYAERIVLVVGPAHRLAAAEAVSWEELAREPLVTSQSETTWPEMLRRLGAGDFAPRQHRELRAVEGLKRLVETGYGVGLAFYRAVERELRLGLLCELVVPGARATVPFGLVQAAERTPAPLVERLVVALRAAAMTDNARYR